MKTFDVLVIGAGPAGSAAAVSLAQSGYTVALIDKQNFPRDKLCGDFINPINWPILVELGVAAAIRRMPHQKVTAFRITTCSGEDAVVPLVSSDAAGSCGMGMRRSSFDHVLQKQAAHDGVAVLANCHVRELTRQSSRWLVQIHSANGPEQLAAAILIGADGRNSWVAHRLGLSRAAEMHGRSVGFQIRLSTRREMAGKIEIHLFPGGYAGAVGIGDGVVNVALAIDKQGLPRQQQSEFLWRSILTRNPYLKEISEHGERLGDVRSTYPVYFKPRRSFADGVLLVGDAARVNEPVSGEGIYYAMKSGQLAAAAVDRAFCRGDSSASTLREYERDCRRVFRLRRGVNRLMKFLIYRPALVNPLIALSAKQDRLLGSLVRSICAPHPAKIRSHHEALEGHEG